VPPLRGSTRVLIRWRHGPLREQLWHGHGESLFNGECRRLTGKTRFVEDLHKERHQNMCYENRASSISELRMAGQVDLLMRNEDSTE
jgi:hypothetical protein